MQLRGRQVPRAREPGEGARGQGHHAGGAPPPQALPAALAGGAMTLSAAAAQPGLGMSDWMQPYTAAQG